MRNLAIVVVGIALLAVIASLVGFLTESLRRPSVAAQVDARSGAARGVVVRAEDLPRDARGAFLAAGLPGVVSARRVQSMRDQAPRAVQRERDRLSVVEAADAMPDTIPVLPGDDQGPPDVDSGDPDPDRLNTKSIPDYAR